MIERIGESPMRFLYVTELVSLALWLFRDLAEQIAGSRD